MQFTDDGDKDHIKGFINVKKFLTEYASGKTIKIANYIHELPMIFRDNTYAVMH